jgi:hypothetical protein
MNTIWNYIKGGEKFFRSWLYYYQFTIKTGPLKLCVFLSIQQYEFYHLLFAMHTHSIDLSLKVKLVPSLNPVVLSL